MKSIPELKDDLIIYMESINPKNMTPNQIMEGFIKKIFHPKREQHFQNIAECVTELVGRELKEGEIKPLMDEIVLFMDTVADELNGTYAMREGFLQSVFKKYKKRKRY